MYEYIDPWYDQTGVDDKKSKEPEVQPIINEVKEVKTVDKKILEQYKAALAKQFSERKGGMGSSENNGFSDESFFMGH